MNTFLISYGDENDLWTCEADDASHAAEQFVNAQMCSPNDQENFDSITAVMLCMPQDFSPPEGLN